MFVGIVQGIGKIIEKKELDQGLELVIDYPSMDGLNVGDSIAVNGVCLTVISFDKDSFRAQLVSETIRKTNLSFLRVGQAINIENAAKIGDSIGGHIVQGHVDSTGEIVHVWQDGIAQWLKIKFDKKFRECLVPKGFIAVDGMSLTVVDIGTDYFTVTVIPHTQQKTVAQYYEAGCYVNLEFDMVMKQRAVIASRETAWQSRSISSPPTVLLPLNHSRRLQLDPLASLHFAQERLKSGGMIILTDDTDRENEGDLVIAAEFATPEAINFMIKKAGGIVCVSVEESILKKFNIPIQPVHRASTLAANFSVSIDAAQGITTGVSAADRAKTIAVLLDPESSADDIATPGHTFPLCAKPKGVLERRGHTEGSIDLMKITGLKPMAVICEIVGDDGEMLRGEGLNNFAQQYDLPSVSIQSLVQHRLVQESWVELQAQSRINTKQYGEFMLSVFKNKLDDKEMIVMHALDFKAQEDCLVRLHSSCFTGDFLGSTRCDCGEQFEMSLKKILNERGVLIYLPQEGRGIGLANKIKAYALQDQGLDTVEANLALGFEDDARDYAAAAHVLRFLGISSVQLLTNNPRKVSGLEYYGVVVSERVPLRVESSCGNRMYLAVKKEKLGHVL